MAREKIYYYFLILDTKKAADPCSKLLSLMYVCYRLGYPNCFNAFWV